MRFGLVRFGSLSLAVVVVVARCAFVFVAAFLVVANSGNVFSAALPVDSHTSRGDTALKRDAT